MKIVIGNKFAGAGTNATPAVVKALEESAAGDEICFEPAEYHFYAAGARASFFRACYQSGGEKRLKRVAFPVYGKKDLTLNGQGARFVFHDGVYPFALVNSEQVTLKNFSCDTFLPPVAVATVESADDDRFVLRFNEAAPRVRDDGRGHFIVERETGEYNSAKMRFSVHSLDRLKIRYLYAGNSNVSREGLPAGYFSTDAEVDGKTAVFRYRADTNARSPYTVGERICLNLEESRERCLFFLDFCRNVTISDISVCHGAGMGVMALVCRDLTVERFRYDAERYADGISTTADVFHLINCTGLAAIRECDFGNSLDDILNLHGNYTVTDAWDGEWLTVAYGHRAHRGFDPYRAGDRVRWIDPETSEILAEGTVRKRATCVGTGRERLRMPVRVEYGAERIAPGQLVELPEKMPDLLLENNRFYSFPHIRLSGGGTMRVLNNRFSDCACAIHVQDLWKYWYESGRVRSLEIVGNRFERCSLLNAGEHKADVRIGEAGEPALLYRGIRIAENTFTGVLGLAVRAYGAEVTTGGNFFNGRAEIPDDPMIQIHE